MEQKIRRASSLKLLIGLIVCALLFGLIVLLLPSDFTSCLDNAVYGLFSPHISDAYTSVALIFSFLVTPIPMLIILLPFFALFFVNGYHFSALSTALCAGLTALAANGIKLFFNRPRPSLLPLVTETGTSFPSAHSALAAAFFGVLLWYVLRCARLPRLLRLSLVLILLLLILGVGASRIYLGVHYATDVLAGFAFGGVMAFGFLLVQSFIVNRLTADGQ